MTISKTGATRSLPFHSDNALFKEGTISTVLTSSAGARRTRSSSLPVILTRCTISHWTPRTYYLECFLTGSPVFLSMVILTKKRDFVLDGAFATACTPSPTWFPAEGPWLRPLFFSQVWAWETDLFSPLSVCILNQLLSSPCP